MLYLIGSACVIVGALIGAWIMKGESEIDDDLEWLISNLSDEELTKLYVRHLKKRVRKLVNEECKKRDWAHNI